MITAELLVALDRFRDIAKSLGPVEFYTHVRQNGCSRFCAHVLLRDLFDKNLVECMQIERDAGPIEETRKADMIRPSKSQNPNTKI